MFNYVLTRVFQGMGRKASCSECVWNSQQLYQYTWRLWITIWMVWIWVLSSNIAIRWTIPFVSMAVNRAKQIRQKKHLNSIPFLLLLLEYCPLNLRKEGLKLIISPQLEGIIWLPADLSVQKMFFHPAHSPVGEGGKDNPKSTIYCSQSRKRQKLWEWCPEISHHGLKTRLPKGKNKVSLTCQLRIQIPKCFCFSAFSFNNHSSACFPSVLGRTGSQSREYRLFQSAPVQLMIVYTAVHSQCLPAEAWPRQLTLY